MAEQKSYGRNWKKYIIWYIVAGVIIYALIYFLFIKGKGSPY